MDLLGNMQNEPVSRLALREPVTARTDELVRTAIERMREKKLGTTIIVDEKNKPLGMFTEAMLIEMVSSHPQQVDTSLGEHLSGTCPWVKLTDSVADVLAALEVKNTRFIAVVDEAGRLVGLTGQKGLMEYVADHFPGQVAVQRVGGSPFPHEREGA